MHCKLFSELMFIEMGVRIFWTLATRAARFWMQIMSIFNRQWNEAPVYPLSAVMDSTSRFDFSNWIGQAWLCRCCEGFSPKLHTQNLPVRVSVSCVRSTQFLECSITHFNPWYSVSLSRNLWICPTITGGTAPACSLILEFEGSKLGWSPIGLKWPHTF